MNWNRNIIIAVVLIVLSLGAAIYFYRSEKEHQRAVTQTGIEEAQLEEVLADEPDEDAEKITVGLFYYRPNSKNPGRPDLVSDEIEMVGHPSLSQTAREIANRVLDGSRRFVPETARVVEIYLMDDGTAVVDLSRDTAEKLDGGIESELGLLQSIARSLTHNLKEIKRVRFLVGGVNQPTFSGHVSIRDAFR